MPDPIFNDLCDDTRRLVWPGADQVRARGAQRARRHRLAAMTAAGAAVVVLAGGAVALGAPQAPRRTLPVPADSPYRPAPIDASAVPSAPAATAPSAVPRTSAPVSAGAPATSRPPSSAAASLPQGPVPKAAMLQPVDVGRGELGVFDTEGRDGSEDWRMPRRALDCDPDKAVPMPPVRAGRTRSLVNENAADKLVVERVERFATVAQARRRLDDVQTMVRACLRASDPVFLSIVVHDFAGPGSLLVRSLADAQAKTLHVWVRQGNLVAEVWAKTMPTDQAAVELGRRAAARLCQGTTC